MPLTAEIRQDFINAQEQMANQGLRVLAFAWRELEAEHRRLSAGARPDFDGAGRAGRSAPGGSA